MQWIYTAYSNLCIIQLKNLLLFICGKSSNFRSIIQNECYKIELRIMDGLMKHCPLQITIFISVGPVEPSVKQQQTRKKKDPTSNDEWVQ